MATTIAAATLKVTLKEDIVLNGRQQGGESTLSISSINEISKRIVTVSTTESEILAFDTTTIAAGKYIRADIRYIRITNLDDTNHITLTFKNHNDDEFAVKLDRGQSYIYNADLDDGAVATMDAIDGTGLTLSLGDLVNVTADADTASCDIEIFVASA
tara:strand:+ start:1084 stop:1557 length:474 start_codon:yes stop_codon:yes gene_type:complete